MHEEAISDQDDSFHGANPAEVEDETAFYARVKNLCALCGYIHTASRLKGSFTQGVSCEVRDDVRDRKRARPR